MDNPQTMLDEWQSSNKRLSLLHLLIDEARKLGYSDEEHEDKLSAYTKTKQAMAKRDEIWRVYFKSQKDKSAKSELSEIIKTILL